MRFCSKKLLYKRVFCFQQLAGAALDLDTVLFDEEVRESRRQLDGHSYLPQFFIVLGVRLGLIKLLVLHEHDRDGQVEQKERANNDAHDEVGDDKLFHIDVLVDVHDLGPSFHCDALENGQEGVDNIVEVGQAPIELIEI